jgi:hypothetical protein
MKRVESWNGDLIRHVLDSLSIEKNQNEGEPEGGFKMGIASPGSSTKSQ